MQRILLLKSSLLVYREGSSSQFITLSTRCYAFSVLSTTTSRVTEKHQVSFVICFYSNFLLKPQKCQAASGFRQLKGLQCHLRSSIFCKSANQNCCKAAGTLIVEDWWSNNQLLFIINKTTSTTSIERYVSCIEVVILYYLRTQSRNSCFDIPGQHGRVLIHISVTCLDVQQFRFPISFS